MSMIQNIFQKSPRPQGGVFVQPSVACSLSSV